MTVFLILGTMQLFLMMQGRIMAHYALARATRAGSMGYGDCQKMTHAALAALMPAIFSYANASYPGGTNGAKLANAFAARITNAGPVSVTHYSATEDRAHLSPTFGGAPGVIFWIAREAPTIAQVTAVAGGTGEDDDFDQFTLGGAPQDRLMRLETRMIFWFPLRVPFANWVIARMVLASWGITAFTTNNPLMPVNQANWAAGSWSPAGPIAGEFQMRVANGEYVVPIDVNYTMRMMTPAKMTAFPFQNCPPTPAGI